jgi:Dolichyl-phosphate-mannose-protein mannosyltransferase
VREFDGSAVSNLTHVRAITWILVGFAFCELLIWPSADIPLIDDWTYAWSVSNLLETGRLEILSISAVYPVTQILWGALFSLPHGFSFAALRLSTVVLAAIGSCALYLTLCELGIERRRALLGALCVAWNPVSIVLAHSFMTDVPLVAFSSCAGFAYVRGFVRNRSGWLWAAVPLSVAAVLVRQIAIVVPLAAAVTSLCTRDRALRRLGLSPSLVACVAALAVWAGIGSLVGTAAVQNERLSRLQYIASVSFGSYVRLTLKMLFVLALMLLPITLATLCGRRWTQLIAIVGPALVSWPLFAGPNAWNPLAPDHATLSVYELGSARNLVAGDLSLPAHLAWVPIAARILVFLSLGALLTATRGAVLRELIASPAARVCLLIGLLHAALVSLLWLYADRYYLALLPAIIACVLLAVRDARLSPIVAGAALALQLTIGIIGTRDALHYNQVCATTYAALVESGVRPYDIDAGWSFNGWMLYAKRKLPPGVDPERDIPAVTSNAPRPFLFAKTAVEGYRPLLGVRWKGWGWPWPNEFYVLVSSSRQP